VPYLASPDGGDGLPVVVVGGSPELCDRFAAEGFVAAAVEHGARDLGAAIARVQELAGREAVGIVGASPDGELTLVLALDGDIVACDRPAWRDAVRFLQAELS
jgi:hypothetical protein